MTSLSQRHTLQRFVEDCGEDVAIEQAPAMQVRLPGPLRKPAGCMRCLLCDVEDRMPAVPAVASGSPAAAPASDCRPRRTAAAGRHPSHPPANAIYMPGCAAAFFVAQGRQMSMVLGPAKKEI